MMHVRLFGPLQWPVLSDCVVHCPFSGYFFQLCCWKSLLFDEPIQRAASPSTVGELVGQSNGFFRDKTSVETLLSGSVGIYVQSPVEGGS